VAGFWTAGGKVVELPQLYVNLEEIAIVRKVDEIVAKAT
jgi:hypothetical protein